MTSRTSRWCGLIAALALVQVSPAFAADPEKTAPSEPGPQVRQQMADAHQKMAECLRSDRPLSECRAEMRKSCQMMGEGGCSMMGAGGGMGHGMMGGGMMQGEPVKEQPKK